MCLCIEIRIKYAFFTVLKQIGFPLGGDRFGGCLCAQRCGSLLQFPSFQCLLWQEVMRAEEFFGTELGVCFVAWINKRVSLAMWPFLKFDANVVDQASCVSCFRPRSS